MNNDIMINVIDKVSSTDKTNYCEFCKNHEDGDTLYEMSDWDGGIGFDYIRNIHYCPLCGKKLKKERLKF